ncbi:MAG: ATP-binding cassette domain-containing protein [Bacteroidales bacterium]|nr:ATP-binding cassette domain-containing protein [Bacteroidales bacterium]
MVALCDIELSFGGRELFRGISFTVNPKDRIGLVGRNGAGKSTLLKMLAGQCSPDKGQITYPSEFKVGYLPQQLSVHNQYTVIEATMQAFAEIISIREQIELLEKQLAERTDYDSESYHQLIHRLTELNELFLFHDGDQMRGRAERTLMGLGFKVSDFDRPTSTFSGGWRMRIELAKILLRPSNLLLLDEPTNHLDIESIAWLENFLATYPGAVIVVSHDRKFLDTVTNRTLELSLGKIFDYKANYSQYIQLKAERREQQLAAFQNQQKLIADTQEFIERFRYKATKATQVQSRIKQLEKLEIVEIESDDIKSLNIRFPNPIPSGKLVLELKNISKSFANHTVIKNINLTLERGERVAFVGKNGEGKTTLSRIIVGQLDYEGHLKLGHNVKIGYFAQNQDELFDEELTVFETIDQVAVGEIRTKIRDILGAFLFSGDDIQKKVKVLSGGERSRLAIARLLLEPYNLLVLDEPTNHLDMRSKDILKQALLNYEGTLILVSHDRDFLDGLVNKIYEFRDQKIFEHIGSIYEFLEKKKIESLSELQTSKSKVIENTNFASSNKKNYYFEKKEFDKEIKKIQKNILETEHLINQLENQLADMNNLLATNPPSDQLFFDNYQKIKHQIAEQMDSWEKLHTQLEELMLQKENYIQKTKS